jgi:hypothetical protein
MIRAVFRAKTTGCRRGGDSLLKGEKLRRHADIDEEDSGAIEGAQWTELDLDGRVT